MRLHRDEMSVKLWKLEYWQGQDLKETHCANGVAYPIAITKRNELIALNRRSGKFKIAPHSFK